MISVVIPTLDSERQLVPTLSALVAGSAEGIVREAILADGGSRDGSAKIADAAGCEWLKGPADEGERLAAAAKIARGDWLLFLDPGAVLDDGWTREVGVFITRAGPESGRAATFRLAIDAAGLAPRLTETAAAARLALLGTPRADQGLLIARKFYDTLGGHTSGPRSHRRLLARIGRRIVSLRTKIWLAPAT